MPESSNEIPSRPLSQIDDGERAKEISAAADADLHGEPVAAAEQLPQSPMPAPANWRPAKALLKLKKQVNAMAPHRSIASDGMIGDAAHFKKGNATDHNPWVIDGGVGVVTAFDITNDPQRGCSGKAIAEAIRGAKDPRVKYIIWDRHICSSYPTEGKAAWTWRDYTGTNPHNKHMHISVKSDKASYDSEAEWTLPTSAPVVAETAPAAPAPAPPNAGGQSGAPDADAKMKAEEATAKQKASLLRAQADLIKAEAELTMAQKPVDPQVAAANAEKARTDAEKAALESRKGLSDARKGADLSAAQAAIGTVTSSGIAGTVTVKGDAGKGEATLLAALAISRAAAKIATSIAGTVGGKTVVLTPGSETLQYPNYRQFLLGRDLIISALESAITGAQDLRESANKLFAAPAPGPMHADATAEAIPALTAAGVAIDAISKLGSYFMTDYEAGNLAVSADLDQLMSAVAGSLLGMADPNRPAAVVLPGRKPPAGNEFAGIIVELTDQVKRIDSALENATREANRQRALGAADAADKDKHLRAAELCDAAADLLNKALAKSQAFLATLAVADAKGVTLIAKIAAEKAFADAANDANALCLVLDVRATAGGYYTKRNLWTFLGFMPFYVMGGVVVTFQLVDKDGKLKGAGTVPCHAGYANVKNVEKSVNAGT